VKTALAFNADPEPTPTPLESVAAGLRLLADGLEALGREPKAEGQVEGDLSPKEAASRLGVGLSTVYQLAREGKLRVVRIGTSVRVPPAELEAFRKRRMK